MAKRRNEGTLLHDTTSKRCCHSLYSVDMQLGRLAPSTGGLSPPSLLALLGSRCKKRPQYFDDPEAQEEALALCGKPTHCCDTREHAANILTAQTSASFYERRSSSTLTGSKKRPRETCAGPETVVAKANEKADEDTDAEDCTYNSFQFWRVPLPELDLSLLQDAKGRSHTKYNSKMKDFSADDMET